MLKKSLIILLAVLTVFTFVACNYPGTNTPDNPPAVDIPVRPEDLGPDYVSPDERSDIEGQVLNTPDVLQGRWTFSNSDNNGPIAGIDIDGDSVTVYFGENFSWDNVSSGNFYIYNVGKWYKVIKESRESNENNVYNISIPVIDPTGEERGPESITIDYSTEPYKVNMTLVSWDLSGTITNFRLSIEKMELTEGTIVKAQAN